MKRDDVPTSNITGQLLATVLISAGVYHLTREASVSPDFADPPSCLSNRRCHRRRSLDAAALRIVAALAERPAAQLAIVLGADAGQDAPRCLRVRCCSPEWLRLARSRALVAPRGRQHIDADPQGHSGATAVCVEQGYDECRTPESRLRGPKQTRRVRAGLPIRVIEPNTEQGAIFIAVSVPRRADQRFR